MGLWDALIWIGSVGGGISIVWAVGWGLFQAISRQVESTQAQALLGDWFGYAFYQARDKPLFYRERITISRAAILRWKFRIKAIPITTSATEPYIGEIRVAAPFIFCATRERVYEDRTFEIGKRIMDERHSNDIIVGLHMGKTYDDNVFSATAYVWLRQPWPDCEKSEVAQFQELVSKYFDVDPQTYQLKLR